MNNFKARAYALVAPRGDLYLYESRAVSGQRTARQIRADGGDLFNFGLVLAGGRQHRDENDRVTVARPGDFFCYDATRVSRVAWQDHRGMHLSLPRTLVVASVGKPLPDPSRLIRMLKYSHLAPLLRSHFRVLAREFCSLTLSERAAMFETTVDFLLSVLREVIAQESEVSTLELRAYFTTAKRVIQEQFSDPNLTLEMVAHALHCSRSTLYRAFNAHGTTVARYIREFRLQEAKRRIAASPPGASIAAIAAECGFYDPAYFRRLFRARFDMSPSDVRDTVGSAPSDLR